MSSFGEAIVSSMIAGMDPEAGMKRDYMASVVKQNQVSTAVTASEAIAKVGALLAAQRDSDSTDPVVANAYAKVLGKLAELA